MRSPLNALTLTPYLRRHRHAVRDLLFRSYRTHTHLDWQETDQWLDEGENYPARLAWQGNHLLGILATSAPLNQTCWIRLAAVSDHTDTLTILSMLWDDLKPDLRAQNVHKAELLLIRNWITPFAGTLGFHYIEEIITFRRPALVIPEERAPLELSMRLAQPEDLPAVLAVDNSAFVAPWQMDHEELRQAMRISASCTVAEQQGELVGYQLSTLYFDGAHLARLAVAPQVQGTGVARALLIDVLRRFERRGVRSMTVNTQASNMRSQRLYTGFGFERTGYDLPVWEADV
ncbi:MAG TPA: GNAT family N-acetyltransferase [Phototrophicaceae bacterium]|nr:GNAT family N-acetyltransferase [Phototrophicaceae bacterium]